MDDNALEVIEPATGPATYRGETLDLRPLTVGATPRIVRLARPVINSLLDLEALPDEDEGAWIDLALDLIEKHGDAVFQAVALAVGREPAWIEGGDIAEFVDLCRGLYEVNRDFFVRRLAPLLQERAAARAKAAAKHRGTGPTPSSSSPSAATR
ncbi:DUF6631 family protein [Luteimonas sp. FCS-9]|uniref:DUF6631 family protein n=1 Tax=Luteimonas sp. FCS-9 TaxID=1547516 RepID=UPI00063E6D77|nr:DUF6631 family protein [Luteimonas sp. FCS-9]KLJ02820.1 hypothetical protein WQ56_00590 [Luteimonas sp. FCS-9]